jgi:cytochrome c-type protein NapC
VSDAPAGRKSLWTWLWERPARRWLLGVPVGAFLALGVGAIGWVTFETALAMSNTEAFCTSCHEMRDNVYAEYQGTIHDKNRTGVRATCPDCHVPHAFNHKMARKIQASFKELPNHFLGKIDTPAKFQAHRQEMAESVWASMRATDSRECRNCHKMEHMDLEVQDKSAKRKHAATLEKKDKTCIDCHQGIAHKLPEETAGAEAAPAAE